jgi:hypothetical protein
MPCRRAVPLALAVALGACEPSITSRDNPATVDYALFDPSNGRIPLPNDVALAQIPGSITSAAQCAALPDAQSQQLCLWKFQGGFPSNFFVQVGFVRGTVAGDGSLSIGYPPAAEALDLASVRVAGAALSPNVAIFDVTNPAAPAPVPASKFFDPGSGKMTLVPAAAPGTWTAGHKYAVLVLGGANGVKTLLGGAMSAMPTLYILRESILSNRDLSRPENQGLFPGDAAARAAAGASLEPLRRGYQALLSLTLGIEAATCAGSPTPPTCIRLPFGELVSMQSFTVQP